MASIENKEVYFAGPLFDVAEKDFNLRVTQRIESELGLTVFLPQRDGYELASMPNIESCDNSKVVFSLDEQKIIAAEAFVIVLDGPVPDPGSTWELGGAYFNRKHTGKPRIIVGLHTDVRSMFIGQKLNPMLKESLDYVASTEDELIEYVGKRIDESP